MNQEILDSSVALVAVCHARPSARGRVGWGFRQADGAWHIGSAGETTAQGIAAAGWERSVRDLNEALAVFLTLEKFNAGFEYVKLLPVSARSETHAAAAEEVCRRLLQDKQGAAAAGNARCVYEVLQAFAPGCLPCPQAGDSANDWYYPIVALEELDLQEMADQLPAVVIPPEWVAAGASPVPTPAAIPVLKKRQKKRAAI